MVLKLFLLLTKIKFIFTLSEFGIVFWKVFLISVLITKVKGGVSKAYTTDKKPFIVHGNCEVTSTEYLLKFGREHKFQNGIPKIIHYVYKTNYIPAQYSPHVKNCMQINNDTQFVFWSDFNAYRLVLEHFPKYINLYSGYYAKFADSLKISDVSRYFILLKFGGIYMDLDTYCQKPFRVALVNESCVLSREIEEQSRILWNIDYLAMNSFMMCLANHNFFQYLVSKLTKADDSWVVAQTGPILLTNTFISFSKMITGADKMNSLNSVSVADAYRFSPFTETFLESRCHGVPSGSWRVKGCKDLAEHRRQQKIKTSKAIVVHLFMHLGYQFAKHNIRLLDNVCISFENINVVWF